MLQRFVVFSFLLLALSGCTSQSESDRDLLHRLADIHYTAAFHFEDEHSVMLTIDMYENGERQDEPIMYFGNYFIGEGSISFTYFLPSMSTLENGAFFIAAIEDNREIAQQKMLTSVPSPFTRFSLPEEQTLTEKGDYILGAVGFLTAETATSVAIPSIDVEPRADVVEAYKAFPLVYVITAQVD